MTDQRILVPFFLDEPMPGLLPPGEGSYKICRPSLPEGTTLERVAAREQATAAAVEAAAAAGGRPVVVAGDCLVSLGTLAGLQAAGIRPHLVWFDAHGDFNTPDTSPSGFLGGMPLAIAAGAGDRTIAAALGLEAVPETRLTLVGARDLDPDEETALGASAVTVVADVTALLDRPVPVGPLYVHFDTDLVDPGEAPAMNYPAPGGPSAATVARVFSHLAASGRVAAASLSAWNPRLDPTGECRRLLLGCFEAVLG